MREVVPRNYEYFTAWVVKLDSDFSILCFVVNYLV